MEQSSSWINPELQRKLLVRLKDAFPSGIHGDDLRPDSLDTKRNLLYLEQHGFITLKMSPSVSGQPSIALATITMKGADSLEEDGGLTAKGKMVTVRLEAETLKALLAAKIDASTLPAEEKSRLKTLLSNASDHVLSRTISGVIDKAIEHGPGFISAVQSALM
ncbi:hypothetical protein ACG02S_07880 [Roseateles sp. DC23W]|uniref:Transcriptional regulator n=1 Tax=Pelomonas dachongensis TaxID=3299029 RepID=A0ABW7EK26_9BURK